MSEMSEALRLADALEISSNHGIRREAAAELRRLHAQRDALLNACKGLLNLFEQHEDRAHIKSPVGDYARAAIKTVEEGK